MKYPQSAQASTPPNRLQGIITTAVALLLLGACARQGAPTGGPKDTTPPAIDTLASTPNFTTRFDQKRIELKFNEWVVLSDIASQVVVSPPLAKRPEVVLKGKSVVVNFDKAEVFRPNTTYTLNFGTAVRDFHENNPAKDLRFVFSTGDFIDSLSFRGSVLDAFTGEPVENVSVMLYENFADSAVRKERPYYFSRTEKTGQYEFKNLRSGNFRVIGIEDGGALDLKWDGEGERIAFRDAGLLITDSLRGVIDLKIFKNAPKFRLVGQNTNRYGLVKLGFNTPIDSFETQAIAPPGLKTWVEKTPDSLLLWYDLPEIDTSWSLVFQHPELEPSAREPNAPASKPDTIQIRKFSRADFLKNHRINFGDMAPVPVAGTGRGKPAVNAPPPPAMKTILQPPVGAANLLFNYPIAAFDTSRWVLTSDSTRHAAFAIAQNLVSQRQLSLNFAWKQGVTYTLNLLPGALTDVWGSTNTDTLRRAFNVLAEKQLGTLSLNLEALNPGSSYVVQLLNGNNLEQTRAFKAGSNTEKLVFNYLQVATYTARLIEDRDGNGRWDTGNFRTQRQPERVFTKKLDALRANWELEASFSTEGDAGKKRKQ